MVLALALVATDLGGCGIGRQSRSEQRRAAIANLSVGMSRQQVLSLMGKPQGREIRGRAEFLLYETNPRARSPSERFTQIAIVDNRVVGWERNDADPASESQVGAGAPAAEIGPSGRAVERGPRNSGQIPER